MDDLFSQLPQGSLDGVVFAVMDVTLRTGSAAAFHKFPHRPGQKVELMGREPVSGTLRCAMFNGLVHEQPGGQNVLWPGAMQRLREKVQLQKTLPLVIPPYGTLTKAHCTIEESYTSAARNGCYFSLTFAEDSTDLIQIGGSLPAAKASLSNAAARADLELAASKIANQRKMEDANGLGVTDFVSAVAAFQYSLDTAGANLSKPIRQASAIVGAVQDLLKTSKALLDPTTWQARDALLDLLDVTKRTVSETKIVQAGRTVRSLAIGAATTLPSLASSLGNTVEDLLALNSVADAYDIDAGEIVFYFAPN